MNRAADRLRFGGYVADLRTRRLIREDGDVVLPTKAFDLLELFLQAPGEVVAKEEVLRILWPGTVVEEGNVSNCVFLLRKALRERPGDRRFIVTVPGRGYRFVAQVQPEAPRGSTPRLHAIAIAALLLAAAAAVLLR